MKRFNTMKVFHGRFTKHSDEEDIRAIMKSVIERLDGPFSGYANRTSTIDRFVEIIKKINLQIMMV